MDNRIFWRNCDLSDWGILMRNQPQLLQGDSPSDQIFTARAWSVVQSSTLPWMDG